jgi:alkylation response protein AidB-like acyl-CoA dehydrogenase
MPLYLNDEQQMLRDTARDFVADAAPVSHMRSLRDADDPTGFSRDLWKQFAEMGFTGILVGEDQDGLGLSHVAAGWRRSGATSPPLPSSPPPSLRSRR